MTTISFAAPSDQWLLTTARFTTEAVVLKNIGPAGVTILPAAGGKERQIPPDDFLDLTRSIPLVAPADGLLLHMIGGDQLTGQPIELKTDSLVWNSPELGRVEIPASRLLGVTHAGQAASVERPRQDVVHLNNGDSVAGIIALMNGQKITVQTSAGNSDVPLASVASISFAATPGQGEPTHGFRVRIDDASSLVCSAVSLDKSDLALTLDKGAEREIPLDRVVSIEQVNGPVSWLSSRPPNRAIYYRFMGGPLEPAAYMDRSWGGQRAIQFKGRVFAHGIGVHAFSSLTWPLSGKYAAFRTRYAVAGDGGGVADVTIRIKLDDKIAYEKSNQRSGRISPVIVLDLKGAKSLTLEVDGSAAYAQDALDWIEPALLKDKPTEPVSSQDDEPATSQPTSSPATPPGGSQAAANSNSLISGPIIIFTHAPKQVFTVDVGVKAATRPSAIEK